jgi:hypothetical protein
MEIVGNIRVGKRDVAPSAPSHSSGVREGNRRKSLLREPGFRILGPLMATATERRSTGVNARARRPIDPRMPVLTPA